MNKQGSSPKQLRDSFFLHLHFELKEITPLSIVTKVYVIFGELPPLQRPDYSD